jgi:hypothetical protein
MLPESYAEPFEPVNVSNLKPGFFVVDITGPRRARV